MILVSVLVEIKANYLNRPFIYLYQLNKKISVGVRVSIPFKKRIVVGYVIDITETDKNIKEYEETYGFNLLSVKDVLDAFPILNKELFTIAKKISEYYLCSMVSVLQAMLPPSLRPSTSSLKAPKIFYRKYLLVVDDFQNKNFQLTSKQEEIFNLIKKNKKISKNSIKNLSIIKKLLQLKIIKEVSVEEKRLKNVILPIENQQEEKQLTFEQQNAVNNILNSKNNVSLLEGVTGSGKTEVYLTLSKKIVESGKSVIILVPEISLTDSMIRYFKNTFGYNIAIFHSRLTAGEKYDEYRHIASGEIKVVIGARSAIFAPVLNLGLIVIDEEHSSTYKNNRIPFYFAHNVALMRSKMNDALVVLGSATPSLETKIKAIKGIYNHVKLTKRINQLPLPKTYVIDLNKENKTLLISDFLYKKINEKVLNKEQVILLMNRRGFSTSVICNTCKTVFKCPNCGILLVYHKQKNFLKCHNCGFDQQMFNSCNVCNSKDIVKIGIGIELIENELKKIFPKFSISRIDSDINDDEKSHLSLVNKIIDDFRNKKIDILLGTQMIAKSYDFPNVTLAAIILADTGFLLPSFRKNENIFNLIVQTIGRSGRADKQGEAIIQTFSPEHYIIKQACEQNYDAFFREEMKIRKMYQYPPYVKIIVLILKSKNQKLVSDISSQIFNELVANKFKDTTIMEPVIPHIPFDKKKYLQKIIIKYKKNDDVKKYIKDSIIDFFSRKSSIDLIVDVDSFEF